MATQDLELSVVPLFSHPDPIRKETYWLYLQETSKTGALLTASAAASLISHLRYLHSLFSLLPLLTHFIFQDECQSPYHDLQDLVPTYVQPAVPTANVCPSLQPATLHLFLVPL